MGQDELDALRKQIDSLDDALLDTLARRMEVVKAVGRYKKAYGMPLRDEERLKALLKSRLAKAGTLGLPDGLISELYELMHKYALEIESEA